jgi:hypothetical protein
MPNELDEFLGDVKTEEQDVFKTEVEDPLAQPLKKEEKPEVKDEEVIPFHKDPKVQKYIDREIERRMPRTEERTFVEDTKKDDDDPLLDVLTRVIGNDTPEKISAIKDFRKALDSRDEKVRSETLREIDARVSEEREAEQQATNELVEGFENIEDTFNVDLTSNKPTAVSMRKEFVDFIQRIAPKDEDGQVTEFPDLEETFKLFQDIKKGVPIPPNRAKELAARSVGRSSDSTVVPQNTDKSWGAVERWLNKLSG